MKNLVRNLVLFIFCFVYVVSTTAANKYKLKVISIATEETDGYKRFMRSAKYYGIDVEVFGMNEQWLGGDLQNGPGGGHKINLLRSNVKKYKDEKNLLLMFTDSYDVIFNDGPKRIMKIYEQMNATVIFSAEDFCWPDRSLASAYPKTDGYRYLCSGGFIGPAPLVYELLTLEEIANSDDDQLYHTKIYLEKRDKYNIILDHKAVLFQNLNGNKEHVIVNLDKGDAVVENIRFNTFPVVIHGNGPSKLYLDHLGNYIAKSWDNIDKCVVCKEGKYSLEDKKQEDWPQVLIGLFIPRPAPFVVDYLEYVFNLDYPKEKLDVYIHSADQYHDEDVDTWLVKAEDNYRSVTYKSPKNFLTEDDARDLALYHCKLINCAYYFSIDSEVSLTNNKTLKLLLEQNRTILAPKLSRPEKLWSNFWGAIQPDGFYARSADYLEIVRGQRQGVWNVPFIASAYLLERATLEKMVHNPFFSPTDDQDMTFAGNNRKAGFFMYVTNMDYYGHLKDTENYVTKRKHNDLYQIFDNILDWEIRYLHKDYRKYLDEKTPKIQPCPDVYWFPFVTDQFTKELIEECEHFGGWSGGKNEDARIVGGYENVPTVDIHMKQIGFENHWLQMLKEYIKPMATHIYHGYYPHCRSHMNFVVKYTPNGQFLLRPHHDASTFTINMALNRKGVDYEGGGARFTRYNCSVKDTQVGWALMHPGRLTHQHEGLPTTNGTRYIMVSFIDP